MDLECWFILHHWTTEQKIAHSMWMIFKVWGKWFMYRVLHHMAWFIWHRCQKSETTFNLWAVRSLLNCPEAVLTNVTKKLGWCRSFWCYLLHSRKFKCLSLRVVLNVVHFTSTLVLPVIEHLFVRLGKILQLLILSNWDLSFCIYTLLCPPLPGYGRVFARYSTPLYSTSLRLRCPCC